MTTRGFVVPVMVFYRIKVQMGCRTGELWLGLPSVSDPSDYDNLGDLCWREVFVVKWPSCSAPQQGVLRGVLSDASTKNIGFQ